MAINKYEDWVSKTTEDERMYLRDAFMGDVKGIKYFLQNGGNMNVRDECGASALHMAALEGQIEAMNALVEAGIDVDVRDEQGLTAIHVAAASGKAEALHYLIHAGANPHLLDNEGNNCIHHLFYDPSNDWRKSLGVLINTGMNIENKILDEKIVELADEIEQKKHGAKRTISKEEELLARLKENEVVPEFANKKKQISQNSRVRM